MKTVNKIVEALLGEKDWATKDYMLAHSLDGKHVKDFGVSAYARGAGHGTVWLLDKAEDVDGESTFNIVDPKDGRVTAQFTLSDLKHFISLGKNRGYVLQ